MHEILWSPFYDQLTPKLSSLLRQARGRRQCWLVVEVRSISAFWQICQTWNVFYLLFKIPHIYWLGVKKRSSSPFLDSHVFIFKTIMRQWHLVVETPSLDCLFPHNTLSPFHFTSIPSWNCYNYLLLFKLFFFIADLSIVSIFSTVCLDFQQEQDELRCWSASLFPTASAALPSIPVCRSPSLQ